MKNYKKNNLFEVEFFDENLIKFGQNINVSIKSVDLIRGLIDFNLIDYEAKIVNNISKKRMVNYKQDNNKKKNTFNNKRKKKEEKWKK